MRLFTFQFRTTTQPEQFGITAPRAFKTARGADASAINFRRSTDATAVMVRVVELVVQGTGRVVAEYDDDVGKWH